MDGAKRGALTAGWRHYLVGKGAIDLVGKEYEAEYFRQIQLLPGYDEMARKARRIPNFQLASDEAIAEAYEDVSNKYWIKGVCVDDKVKELEQFLDLVNVEDSIIDVGCGPCMVLAFLRANGVFNGAGYGLDISKGMYETAKENVEGLGIELFNCAMQEIPLDDNSVNIVHCVDSLHWTNKWRMAVKEMVRVASETIFIAYGNTQRVDIEPGSLIELLLHLGADVTDFKDFQSATGLQRVFVTAKKGKRPSGLVVATTF